MPREVWIGLAAVLAVYRVAHMIALEDGPWDLFSSAREAVGQATWFGRGLHCVLCISWWMALPVALLVARGWWILLAWPAIAGGVALVHKAGGYRE